MSGGAKARPMHESWARSLRDQCAAVGVPYFFKQWGEWAPCPDGEWHGLGPAGKPQQGAISHSGKLVGGFLKGTDPSWMEGQGWVAIVRRGKRSGRLLDGREHNEFPEVVR